MKILMVLTSHDQLGDTGLKTGFWLEEFAAPYFVFRGRRAAADPGFTERRPAADRSEKRSTGKSDARHGAVQAGRAAQKALSHTVKLADMKSEDFDTVFYPGGHGPMWDLAESPDSDRPDRVLLQFRQAGGVGLPPPRRASSCHLQGRAAREGEAVTGFTNGEEEEMQLTKVVPFLVEDELMRLGAYSRKSPTGSPSPSSTAGSSPARIPRPRPSPPKRFSSSSPWGAVNERGAESNRRATRCPRGRGSPSHIFSPSPTSTGRLASMRRSSAAAF